MNNVFRRVFFAVVLFLAAGSMLCAAPARSLVNRINSAKEYIDDIMEAPDTEIPSALIEKCRGVVIMRQYRAGFVFGIKGGAGIAIVRDEKTKQWGPPAFIKAGEGSFGIQIGGQSIDSILLIMNKEGMEMMMSTKFKVGVGASAAVGPVGRDAEAKVGPGTAILVYSRAKGLYAGATFEGGLIVNDDSANEKFYNIKGITAQDILFNNRVAVPKEAENLLAALKSYETRYREITDGNVPRNSK